jgi:hypothetical protein
MVETVISSIDTINSLSNIMKDIINYKENLNDLVNSIEKKVNIDRKQIIQKIRSRYRAGHLVLVLGAGVSIDSGLPDWNTLLKKLLILTIKTKKEISSSQAQVIAKAFTNIFPMNQLITGRYLSGFYRNEYPENPKAFENDLKKALYEDYSNQDYSKMLKEIGTFCIAAGKAPNLESIISYNYDELVEDYLESTELDIKYLSVYKAGINPKDNELPIFHVHGYLPISDNNDSCIIAFSEDSYHSQYNDIYSWSNLVQINKFKDENCLFVGISFTDPNLRRLMDIAKKQRGDDQIHHFCFRKKYSQDEIKKQLHNLLANDKTLFDEKKDAALEIESMVTDLVSLIETFESNDAASFGMAYIWIENYDEIPEILKEIRKGT